MKIKSLKCLGEGLTGLEIKSFETNWKLTQEGKPSPSYDVQVPGDVHLALMQAGVIEDPFIGQNNEKAKWVANTVWEYTNHIDVKSWQKKILEQFKNGGIVHTVFDAIDYDATFIVDGTLITRQIGMFSSVDLACGLTQDDIKCPDSMPIKLLFHKQPWWRQHAVKSQMAFGWDFAPELRTVGIWKNIRSYVTGNVYFSELYVFGIPVQTPHNNSVKMNVKVRGTIECLDVKRMETAPGPFLVELEVQINAFQILIPIRVSPGVRFEMDIGLIDLPLWQPKCLGTPERIPVKIRLLLSGALTDEYHGYVVNREVKWARNPGTFPGNENWTVVVNGKKIFVRGINWVPPDSIYGRIDANRYHRLIDAAQDMHIDMLRVWGGGIEEKTEFYDYCDRVGMMVWQEFPYACTNYPRYPQYMRIAKQECEGIVQRTRRHPSVVVYCGGNEFNPYINSHIVSMVKAAVYKYAPDRFCFAVSPFLGDNHDWKPWGRRRMFDGYNIDGHGPFQMLTEYGMQAAPQLDTLKVCSISENYKNFKAFEEDIRYHKGDMNGHYFYAKKFGREITDIPSFIHITQMVQAAALKYATELCRSNWPNVSGIFPWQLSDPWPNISWSVVDHYFRPKLGAKMLQIAYSPVLPMVVNWRFSKRGESWRIGDLIVHNATQDSFKGTIKMEVSQKSTLLSSKEIPFTVSPIRPIKITELEIESLPGAIVRLQLLNAQGQSVVKNFSFPTMAPPQPRLKKVLDLVDVKFDGWWRKHMTHLMELDRIRTDVRDWTRKKKELEGKK